MLISLYGKKVIIHFRKERKLESAETYGASVIQGNHTGETYNSRNSSTTQNNKYNYSKP